MAPAQAGQTRPSHDQPKPEHHRLAGMHGSGFIKSPARQFRQMTHDCVNELSVSVPFGNTGTAQTFRKIELAGAHTHLFSKKKIILVAKSGTALTAIW
jgi:hypothetical protein